MHILVVEDDAAIARLITETLSDAGHTVTAADSVPAADAVFLQDSFDAAIVDVMLPGGDGRLLCRRLKTLADFPIVLLTALDEWEDKRSGFESGADDYITKPFIPEELLYRLRAVAKRYQLTAETTVAVGSLTLDLRDYTAKRGQQLLRLPKKEFELLYRLAAFPGRVYTRDELIAHVWGYDFEGDERTIDVHIKRLRNRLSETTDLAIRTVRGVGYTLEVNP